MLRGSSYEIGVQWEPTEIGLLVIAPSRDLALQIEEVRRESLCFQLIVVFQVAQPFAAALKYTVHSTIGGKNLKTDLAAIHAG